MLFTLKIYHKFLCITSTVKNAWYFHQTVTPTTSRAYIPYFKPLHEVFGVTSVSADDATSRRAPNGNVTNRALQRQPLAPDATATFLNRNLTFPALRRELHPLVRLSRGAHVFYHLGPLVDQPPAV